MCAQLHGHAHAVRCRQRRWRRHIATILMIMAVSFRFLHRLFLHAQYCCSSIYRLYTPKWREREKYVYGAHGHYHQTHFAFLLCTNFTLYWSLFLSYYISSVWALQWINCTAFKEPVLDGVWCSTKGKSYVFGVFIARASATAKYEMRAKKGAATALLLIKIAHLVDRFIKRNWISSNFSKQANKIEMENKRENNCFCNDDDDSPSLWAITQQKIAENLFVCDCIWFKWTRNNKLTLCKSTF